MIPIAVKAKATVPALRAYHGLELTYAARRANCKAESIGKMSIHIVLGLTEDYSVRLVMCLKVIAFVPGLREDECAQ